MGRDRAAASAPPSATPPRRAQPTTVATELERDPAKGRVEWLAEWRDDIANFIDRTVIEAAVDAGVIVRPRAVKYYAFVDPPGDAFTRFTVDSEQKHLPGGLHF